MKNIISTAKKVLDIEIAGITRLHKSIDNEFAYIIKKLSKIKGKVIITGVGKSLIIANKISSTMSSTGTPSQCVDPISMAHGDLGIVKKNDAIIFISNSGSSLELNEIIKYANENSICTIAITSNKKSQLAKSSSFKIILPNAKEACAIGLAPTTSTTLSLMIGDAICVSLMKIKNFKISDYKKIHPGGTLGESMTQIKDIMYTGKKMPVVSLNASMKAVILEMSKKSFGHVGVKNKSGQLIGIISDGDLRRGFKKNLLNLSALDVMTKNPIMINHEELLIDALKFMNKNKITCLFVSGSKDRSKANGIIHLHQILQYVQ
tara:strand:- start:1759 stop:2718 length:960 start_codon:yes stop_codon:yes gene_type:complete